MLHVWGDFENSLFNGYSNLPNLVVNYGSAHSINFPHHKMFVTKTGRTSVNQLPCRYQSIVCQLVVYRYIIIC